MTMKVKVIYGQDIRRWRYEPTQISKLDALREFVASSFGVDSFWLQYDDDEGDRLTLSSDTDFDDAFVCAEQQQRKSLKIYVLSGSLDGMHAQQQQHRQAPSQSNANAPDVDDNDNHDNPNHSFYQLKDAAMDFLSNQEITRLLPELHRRIFEEIKKRKQAFLSAENAENVKNTENSENVSVSAWDSADTIERIIRDILTTDASFSAIVQHRLYRHKLQFMIPRFALKLSSCLPFLLNFSCESLGAWIAHFTSVLSHGLQNDEFSVFDADCDMSSCVPLLCCLMSQHGDCSGRVYDCAAAAADAGTTHWKVSCDACLTSPIKGARFKCLKCKDFDLCGQCESFGKHDPTHPMVKFQRNACTSLSPLRVQGEFAGLSELLPLFGVRAWSQHSQQQQQQQGYGSYGQGYGHCGGNWRYRHHQHKNSHCQSQGQSQGLHGHAGHQNEKLSSGSSSVCSNFKDISNSTSNSSSNGKKKKVTAEFVTDVTLPDRTYYPLDTVLTKTWRMRNNGDHEWGSHVELVFFKGNESLSLEQRYQVVNAAPGQTAEVSAVIKTPNKPGRYCSYYRLQRNGEYFGPRVWVDIFAVDEHEPQNRNCSQSKKKGCKAKQQAQKQLQRPQLPLLQQQVLQQVQPQVAPPVLNVAIEDEQQFLDDIANAVVQDVVIEPQPMPMPPQQQQPNGCMYQAEFLQLKAMGFTDDERIKAQLIEQQGNVQRVANRLLLL